MELELQAGPRIQADGVTDGPLRVERQGGLVVTDAHGHFHVGAFRKQIFSVTLNATSSTVAAGNIVAAAAAASTQFALWNPVSSGVNLSLLKFGMGVISGTPGGGSLFHGVIVDSIPTIAATGTARNHFVNGPAANAKFMASAAGAALTGGSAPQLLRVADFSQTATAAATAATVKAVELLDGDIVLPPGTGWVPLWSTAGTTLLNTYSITWEEIPA